MAAKKPRARVKDANPRKYKKKTSPLILESIDYVDYKNVDLLNRFMSDRAKIRNRRVTGNDVQQQRDIANAIKVAREMGLLPYAGGSPRRAVSDRPATVMAAVGHATPPRPRSPRVRSPPSSTPTSSTADASDEVLRTTSSPATPRRPER